MLGRLRGGSVLLSASIRPVASDSLPKLSRPPDCLKVDKFAGLSLKLTRRPGIVGFRGGSVLLSASTRPVTSAVTLNLNSFCTFKICQIYQIEDMSY